MPPLHGPSWVLTRTALGAVLVVLLGALVALVLSGGPAAGSVLVGGLVVVAVFGTGALAVNAMARRSAAEALLMAMVTYTGQAIVLVAFFFVLSRSGAMDDALSRGWLAGAVIGAALLWSGAQIWLSSRARIPIYNLPDRGGEV